MSVIQAHPSPSCDAKVTALKQSQIKSTKDSIVKSEPIINSASTKESSTPQVRRWWEMMMPEGRELASNAEKYLLDQSVPWSKEGFQHVLTPSQSRKKSSFGTTGFTEEVQDEIILAVLKRIREAPAPNILTQPIIHFVGQHVYVSLLTTQALMHLWSSPPLFRGAHMDFVSKGLFYTKPHISTFKEGRAMKKDAFVDAFKKQYARHVAALSSDSGLQFAYARFYEVSGVPGGPIFSGQVLMFSNEVDVPQVHKPFFIQESPLAVFSFARPNTTG
ncbi:hypothetical protein sr13414 [Sporisorium reilianum SRZ2]|uniref:Uncharacterized protein n=1 Tax=Sporisorium reilianum (strain SRZ2) TaxID=999809 RepID=E6ZZX2_SPORE|nr:hypothetical protein sr13414 [Sporisorium reilianum SRZ2]